MKIMFWNVENLFDIYPNPDKEDSEYTPQGTKRWTYFKFRQKCNNIAKGIINASNITPASIIALCEVENDSCMEFLTKRTPLKSIGYKYYITSSPDVRGINIAMIYDPLLFSPISIKEYEIPIEGTTTRNILYCAGINLQNDTLDLIFCHLPSRRGGVKSSDKNREAAYLKIRELSDSIFALRRLANIIIMGDMNDTPLSKTQKFALKTEKPSCPIYSDLLYNISFIPNLKHDQSFNYLKDSEISKKIHYTQKGIKGTYRFQGKWEILDQTIASGNLIAPDSKLKIVDAYIFCAPYMLLKESKYPGYRPYSSYYGFKYSGGISDHLPIMIELSD